MTPSAISWVKRIMLITFISSVSFYLPNVATRKMTHDGGRCSIPTGCSALGRPLGPCRSGATTQGLLKLMTTLLTGPLLTATQLGQVPTNERSWHFHFPISHKFCYSIFENLPRAQLQ